MRSAGVDGYRAFVMLGTIALSTACGEAAAPTSPTGFGHMEALGLGSLEVHSTRRGETLVLQSTATFTTSIDAMVTACREDLDSVGITTATESESGTPEHRIVDLNGSSDRGQRVCRVEGARAGSGGTVALMDARSSTGPPPSRVGHDFPCGPLRCTESQFCQRVYGQGQPGPAPADEYECRPAAAACAGAARCACMDERASCEEIDGYPHVESPRP